MHTGKSNKTRVGPKWPWLFGSSSLSISKKAERRGAGPGSDIVKSHKFSLQFWTWHLSEEMRQRQRYGQRQIWRQGGGRHVDGNRSGTAWGGGKWRHINWTLNQVVKRLGDVFGAGQQLLMKCEWGKATTTTRTTAKWREHKNKKKKEEGKATLACRRFHTLGDFVSILFRLFLN